MFRQDFTCPVVLFVWLRRRDFVYRTVTFYGSPFQTIRLSRRFVTQCAKLGLFPFRSPLLRESRLLSVPTVTEMFQFTAYTFSHKTDTDPSGRWVAPFGNLRIVAYLRLHGAYRCSSRPSSAPSAKASTLRSCFLNFSLRIIHFSKTFFEKPNGLSKLNRTHLFLSRVCCSLERR